MTVEITMLVNVLPSGKYAVRIITPQGLAVCDGADVGGVCRAASIAIVDVLGETADLRDLEQWSGENEC